MTAQLKSEIRKLVTTRSTFGIVAGMVAVVVAGVLQTAGGAGEAGKPLVERQFFLLATINAQVLLLVLGAKFVTDEYRYGTSVPTFLVTPRRERVVFAKTVAAALAGLVATTAVAAAMVAAAYPHLSGGLTGADAGHLAAFALAGALWAAIGAGVGWIVKHQVGAIVGVIVWVMIVEQMIAARFDGIASYLPGNAGGSLAVAAGLGPAATGALILLAYVVAISLAGAGLVQRRDVV